MCLSVTLSTGGQTEKHNGEKMNGERERERHAEISQMWRNVQRSTLNRSRNVLAKTIEQVESRRQVYKTNG